MTDSSEDGSTAPRTAVPTEALYRALFEASHDGVCVAERGGRLVEVNTAVLQIFGESLEGILELNVAQLFADSRDWPHLCDRSDREGRLEDLELRLRGRDGRDIPGLVTIIGHRRDDGEVNLYQVIICDVTRQRDADERLRHDALHDTLTQLPNRRFFFDRVQRLLHRLEFNPSLLFAVLFLDLDQFKIVNDSLGHRWGDELLVQVGERLVQLVRPEDIVARLGGDEFAILLMDLPGAEEAVVAVTRIHNGIREPFVIEDHPVKVSASLGMVLSEGSYESPEDVIRDADTAMYAAKAAGGRGWVQFDDTMRERVVLRLTMENALRAALDNEEFVVHFQPLVSMETRLLTGFEALLRWQHPERGMLLPGEFLSVAEVRAARLNIHEAHIDTIHRLTLAGEFKDRDTADHVARIGGFSEVVARQMKLSEKIIEVIRHAAPMHDVGKIGIPDAILLKPGKLDAEEIAVMRNHTVIGAQILSNSTSEVLQMGERIALTHHEHWDGSGYPNRIAGEEIPIEARICAVVDVFDAVTVDRPYRKAVPHDEVIEMMIRDSGSHFHADVLDAFLYAIEEIKEVQAKYFR